MARSIRGVTSVPGKTFVRVNRLPMGAASPLALPYRNTKGVRGFAGGLGGEGTTLSAVRTSGNRVTGGAGRVAGGINGGVRSAGGHATARRNVSSRGTVTGTVFTKGIKASGVSGRRSR
jgi:hypothetical protein